MNIYRIAILIISGVGIYQMTEGQDLSNSFFCLLICMALRVK